ncbi:MULTISPECIES: hypothetical protein [Streptomyces]|uniref:hypothetical protein n=1 Tax=Streptomyces TaxID=1883 RepID=UPI0033A19C69
MRLTDAAELVLRHAEVGEVRGIPGGSWGRRRVSWWREATWRWNWGRAGCGPVGGITGTFVDVTGGMFPG